jgi:glycosyltransferase involved in cell wall biosynthesis
MPKLAVVMAVFNGGRFLQTQLDSIAQQSRPPDVLVISDDGSRDGSWDLASEFARSAPFETVLLRGPGAGLAQNFWQAAAHTDAELIAWADQDDVWAADKLARCEAALLEHDAGLVTHSAITVDEDGRSLRRRYPDYRRTLARAPLEGDPWHVPSGFATVFRRRLLAGVPFDARPRSHQTLRAMNHDHVVSLRAFASCRRVEMRETLAYYRQHGSNAAGDPTPKGLDVVHEALRPRSSEYAQLADIAAEYGRFVRTLDGAGDMPGRYFDELAERCRLRSVALTDAPAPRKLRSIWTALEHGVYRRRSRGGFGGLGLARDVIVSAAGNASQKLIRSR